MPTPLSDTIVLPGTQPLGKDGVDPQFLRELVTSLQQMKSVLQSIESNQNAGRYQ